MIYFRIIPSREGRKYTEASWFEIYKRLIE